MSLHFLQLSEAVLVSFLTPVFTALFAFCFLKERISCIEIGGFAFSLVGIVLVAQPPFLTSLFFPPTPSSASASAVLLSADSDDVTTVYGLTMTATVRRLVGVGIGLVGTVFTATAYVLTRKIGKRVHGVVIINWLSLCGLIMPILPMFLLETPVIPQGIEWLQLLGIGALAFLAQTFLTAGLRIGSPGRVAIANYLQIVWSFMWEAILLGGRISVYSLLGSLCIAINAAIALFGSWRTAKHKKAAAKALADIEMDPVALDDTRPPDPQNQSAVL